MNYRYVIVPLIAVILFAIITFIFIWAWRRWKTDIEKDEEVSAYLEADTICATHNPKTGWFCERWMNHPGNHWQTINGERYDWPRT